MRFFNSLQFRLYAIFLLLSMLLVFSIYLNLNELDYLQKQQRSLNYAAQQRSNVYLIATLARRLSDAETDTERRNLTEALNQTVDRFNLIQSALRRGDSELEVEAVQNEQVIIILDEVDERWAIFNATLQNFLALPVEEWNDSPLLREIDIQSTAVFSFSDRVVSAFDAQLEEEQRQFQRLSIVFAVVDTGLFLLTIFVITQIVRSINRLKNTASAFSTGNFAVRADTVGLNEMALVSQSFNEMAQQISTLVVSLEKQVQAALAAHQQAERSNQVKSAFLASMSHELRTPLNSVINYTKFVTNGVMGPINEEQKGALEQVIKSGTHLLSLINDVLDMSKIESGTLNLFVEDNVNLKTILQNVVATSQSLIGDKPIQLITEIDEHLPLIRADRQRILQVLLNIMSNAIKFTQQGQITLQAHAVNNHIHMSIQDTGPGIQPEDFSLVFEPFKQTETGIRQGGGTGLGMPISKSLVEAHKGKLWLKSSYGQGATFYVELPIKEETLTPIATRTKAVR